MAFRTQKIRCESQKANGSSDVSRPYLGQAGARRLSAAAPDHGKSWGMVLDSVYAAQRVSRNVRDATGYSLKIDLERKKPLNNANGKAKVNDPRPNAKAQAGEKQGFDMP